MTQQAFVVFVLLAFGAGCAADVASEGPFEDKQSGEETALIQRLRLGEAVTFPDPRIEGYSISFCSTDANGNVPCHEAENRAVGAARYCRAQHEGAESINFSLASQPSKKRVTTAVWDQKHNQFRLAKDWRKYSSITCKVRNAAGASLNTGTPTSSNDAI